MAVYYRVKGGPFKTTVELHQPLHKQLEELVHRWRHLWQEGRSDLRMVESAERISILDTRPCAAELFTRLDGVYRDLYHMAWKPLAPEAARRALSDRYSPEETDAAARELIERKLMIRLSGLYLALAVPWNTGLSPQ